MSVGLLPLVLLSTALAADPVDTLVAEALASSPTLRALEGREAAMHERAAVAGAWPDPVVSVEYSNAPISSFGLGDHPMSGLQLRVQQTTPTPGWSRARQEVLERSASAERHAVSEAQLRLEREVRRAWWQLVRARLLRQVTTEHQARTDDLLAVARVRYETGSVGQHAILRLEVLRDRLADDLGEFDQQEAVLIAALEAALASEARTFATPDAVTALAAPPPSDWRALASEHRPLLAQLRDERAAAESRANLARLDARPDPSVWAGYRVRTIDTPTDPGADMVSLGVGVPIPVGSARRASGERLAAFEEASATDARIDAALHAIHSEMRAIHARWSRAASKATTYDDSLIPSATATLETTRSDFTVDRADFASLFEAEVALLDLERARIVAAIDTHILAAEAHSTLGIAPTGDAP